MDPIIPPQPPTVSPQPPSTPPIMPTPSTPVKPTSNLLFVFVVIILLLSLGVVGFFMYQNWQIKQQISQVQPRPTPLITPTPTLDPTADWKTYTNGDCKIQVKYPPEWKIVKNCASGTVEGVDCIETTDFNGAIAVTTNTSPTGTAITISCQQYNKEFSNETLLEACLKDKEKDQSRVCERANFGNLEFIIQSQGSFNNVTNNILYTINVEPPSRIDDLKSMIDKILSTFKFISTGAENTTGNQIVTGKVLIVRIDNNTMTVQAIAESTKGNITQMMVWTDSNPVKEWQEFSTLIKVPLSDKVYAKYKDDFNNESPIYSDSIYPEQGPPPPV